MSPPAAKALPLPYQIVENLRAVDWAKLVAALQAIPLPIAIAAILLGLFGLTFAVRFRRPFAGLAAFSLGLGAGIALGPLAQERLGVSNWIIGGGLGAALAAFAASEPRALMFFVGVWPGGLIGAKIVGSGDANLGFINGTVIGGGIFVFLARYSKKLACSIPGAALITLALVALSGSVPALGMMAANFFIPLSIAIALTIVGVLVQGVILAWFERRDAKGQRTANVLAGVHGMRSGDDREVEAGDGAELEAVAEAEESTPDQVARKRWEGYLRGSALKARYAPVQE